jgi:hypothetical protein
MRSGALAFVSVTTMGFTASVGTRMRVLGFAGGRNGLVSIQEDQLIIAGL